MKSEDKMKVIVKRMPEFDNKLWVKVKFIYPNSGDWIPSLEDLCRILRAIAHCEDNKYPPSNYRGRYMLIDFLKEAISDPNIPYETLANKYIIPRINE